MTKHQYVHPQQGVVTERLFGDRVVRFLYSSARERSPALFEALISRRVSDVLGFVNFDMPLAALLLGNRRFLKSCGVNLKECLDDPAGLDTPRKIFERKIRYWECRPMPHDAAAVVSPADARVVLGSFRSGSPLFLKNKFFDFEELLGADKTLWLDALRGGDYAIFRLTPDKYHYNHTPVAGQVVDCYEIAGGYHSCNPGAVVEILTPYSKNRRVVTVFQTDCAGGTRVGIVAMIEIVALMIGEVVQCYSEERYDSPTVLRPGKLARKGVPKSLYRPGSSTTVLIFQPNRIGFEDELIGNMFHPGVESRFSSAFGKPLAETDVLVRSRIGKRNRAAESVHA
jgi:phosphatidylserine decarboxylase